MSSKNNSLHENTLFNNLLLYVFAVFFYGLGFVFYALSLKKLDLSIAYPLMVSVTIIGISAYGILLNGELMTVSKLAGGLLLIIGIFLINR
ncbi:DMT family transporter [Comamonas piscis]